MKANNRSLAIIKTQKPIENAIRTIDPNLSPSKVKELHEGIDNFIAKGIEAGGDVAIVIRNAIGEITSINVLEISKHNKHQTGRRPFLSIRKGGR